jgi:hypothetical protein
MKRTDRIIWLVIADRWEQQARTNALKNKDKRRSFGKKAAAKDEFDYAPVKSVMKPSKKPHDRTADDLFGTPDVKPYCSYKAVWAWRNIMVITLNNLMASGKLHLDPQWDSSIWPGWNGAGCTDDEHAPMFEHFFYADTLSTIVIVKDSGAGGVVLEIGIQPKYPGTLLGSNLWAKGAVARGDRACLLWPSEYGRSVISGRTYLKSHFANLSPAPMGNGYEATPPL